MIHSSTLTVATDRERLTCGGCSLSATIRFGSLEFIADCFSSLTLSPGGDSSAIFMGMTCNRSLSLQAMIEDSLDKFYMASSGEGSLGLPISWRLRTGASPAPTATTQ
jgi:hypothetical protein